jgi:hypothetical protein
MAGQALVEPVPGEPAAVATTSGERVLVVADYHAGIEVGLRYERGVELESAADVRRAHLERLLDRTEVDRLLVLGDLVHRIGRPDGDEVEELRTLVERVTARVPVTLVPGNHDGGVAETVDEFEGEYAFSVADASGLRLGPVGFVHGHTWPSSEVMEAELLCMGHEHPTVRLEDEVGGSRVERAWLRGQLDPSAFEDHVDAVVAGELVVVPAFNDRSGGTWVNVDGQSFLSPFLPEALPDGELYLLDGTRLGPYRRV